MDSQKIFNKKYLRAWNYRLIREFRAKTQDDVVKETGISKQNISYWENLNSNPGQKFIDRLAKFFNLPSETFYVENLTKEYLEKTFKSVNHTPMQKSSDNNGKSTQSPDEALHQYIKDGNSDYILVHKVVILEKYRLVSIEEMDAKEKELQRKHEEDQKELENRRAQIHGLYDIIKQITDKLPEPMKSVEIEKGK